MIKEFWINVYQDFDKRIVYGHYWQNVESAKDQSNLGGRKLLYRIHVRLK